MAPTKDRPLRSEKSRSSALRRKNRPAQSGLSGRAAAAKPEDGLVAPPGAGATLTVDDLIWPIFLIEGKKSSSPIAAMPGVDRLSIDLAVMAAAEAANLGVPAIALFPYTDPSLRDEMASEALNPDNLVCRAVRAIK